MINSNNSNSNNSNSNSNSTLGGTTFSNAGCLIRPRSLSTALLV